MTNITAIIACQHKRDAENLLPLICSPTGYDQTRASLDLRKIRTHTRCGQLSTPFGCASDFRALFFAHCIAAVEPAA